MRTVLIVDDSSFMRRMIGDLLRSNGCTIVGEATDGSEALEAYSRLHPDIVIMDIIMPFVNGIEAVRRIRGYDPAARIIMCSCIGQTRHLKEALSAGAADFITKPFRTETFEKALGLERDQPPHTSVH